MHSKSKSWSKISKSKNISVPKFNLPACKIDSFCLAHPPLFINKIMILQFPIERTIGYKKNNFSTKIWSKFSQSEHKNELQNTVEFSQYDFCIFYLFVINDKWAKDELFQILKPLDYEEDLWYFLQFFDTWPDDLQKSFLSSTQQK